MDGDGARRDPGHDRCARPCHGASGFRPLTLDLSDTNSLDEAQAEDRRICRRQSRTARGSSAAAGTRRSGASAASRPPPNSMRWCPTGRSGSSGSTAMPRWANSCAIEGRPGLPPRRADPAGGRIDAHAGGKQPAGVLVDSATALVDEHGPAAAPGRPRPGAGQGAGTAGQQRHHRGRRHGHHDRGLADLPPRRRRRAAADPHHVLCQRRPRRWS